MTHCTDPLLLAIVEIATRFDDRTEGVAKVAITLQIGGMLVSGHIVSNREFLQSRPLTDKILDACRSCSKLEPAPQDHPADDPLQFIHLSGASFFIPGNHPFRLDRDHCWRGRLSDVSGFFLGLLVESTD
jgi:hypothetical protein